MMGGNPRYVSRDDMIFLLFHFQVTALDFFASCVVFLFSFWFGLVQGGSEIIIPFNATLSYLLCSWKLKPE